MAARSSGKVARCHYEVMGVDRSITQTDLAKAYRKLALQLHPDKNRDDPEAAAERFKELQRAYTVLSDPQERRWYDDHRHQILSQGMEEDDDLEYDEDGKPKPKRTAADLNLWPYFNSSCYGDTQEFFTVYNKVFQQIIDEEAKWAQGKKPKASSFPTFGDENTSYEKVQAFYAFWGTFICNKSFAWVDQYRVSEAPNRQVKRMMEKENSKARISRKKEFNDQVRQPLPSSFSTPLIA